MLQLQWGWLDIRKSTSERGAFVCGQTSLPGMGFHDLVAECCGV